MRKHLAYTSKSNVLIAQRVKNQIVNVVVLQNFVDIFYYVSP